MVNIQKVFTGYIKLSKEDDQYVDALVSVSAALIKRGNLTEAAQHLNRAEQISPEICV